MLQRQGTVHRVKHATILGLAVASCPVAHAIPDSDPRKIIIWIFAMAYVCQFISSPKYWIKFGLRLCPVKKSAENSAMLASAVLRTRLGVLLDSEFPRGAECTSQHILIRRLEPNMSHPHPSPSASNGHEYLRQLPDKNGLLFRREHQIPVAWLWEARVPRGARHRSGSQAARRPSQ